MVAVDVQGVEICLVADAYICWGGVDSADAGGGIPAQEFAALCRPCSAGLVESDIKECRTLRGPWGRICCGGKESHGDGRDKCSEGNHFE